MLSEDISDLELKQRWRLYWIHCIFEFSNIKLQKMSWIEGSEAWPSSFEECFSAYFDDLALDDTYVRAIKAGNVTQEEASRAHVFHMMALVYEEPDENPEMILNDIEWIKVVESAKGFWDYLKETVTSQREIDLMNSLEQEYC